MGRAGEARAGVVPPGVDYDGQEIRDQKFCNSSQRLTDGGFEVPVSENMGAQTREYAKNRFKMLFRVVVLASRASRRTLARAHPCTDWMRAMSPQLRR